MSTAQIQAVGRTFPGVNGGARTLALQPTTLAAATNHFITILGPTGCGQSTLLRIVAGLDTLSTGRVLLDGVAVTGPGAERVRVSQRYMLVPWLTVLDNIGFGLREKRMPTPEQACIAQRFIKEVGLTGFERRYPKQLSGDMQQRVALARSPANDPKILLLSIWELHCKTVLFVTHDIDKAIFMANRCTAFSARPGRIKTELAIDLAYPRHYTVKTTPRFSQPKAQLTEETRVETLRAVELER